MLLVLTLPNRATHAGAYCPSMSLIKPGGNWYAICSILAELYGVWGKGHLSAKGKEDMSTVLTQTGVAYPTIETWLREAERIGQIDGYMGRRRWVRYSWHVPLEIDTKDRFNRPVILLATGRDISTGGLGVHCRTKLPAMSVVSVRRFDQKSAVQVRVMHCTQTVNGYRIGMEFLDRPPQAELDSAA